MKSTYQENDVTLLLKDISGMVEPLDAKMREMRIQSGVHYCEMLPLEYKPSEKYMELYEQLLALYAQEVADAVARVSEMIYQKKGDNVALVSLARAGTPIGILMKRYLKNKYHKEVAHYSISIIRGRGIDKNAMRYILDRHSGKDIQFVDGWVGKGAISHQLKCALNEFSQVDDTLAVLSDPAGITSLCGTQTDLLIPSSCLNCTVSGLISRTFLRDDIISQTDFHGAAFYQELEKEDRTYEFIDTIEKYFQYALPPVLYEANQQGVKVVKKLQEIYEISDVNLIKPGIGETTRVLLRRIPWKVILNEKDKNTKQLSHIIQLAKEKEVPIEYKNLGNYKCCGIIKKMADT